MNKTTITALSAVTVPLGLVFYRGPSMLDGKPIVGIISGLRESSSNSKTGEVLQTYILCADMHPMDAIHSGFDVSICGGCIHRGDKPEGKGRTCYVQMNGVIATWDSLQAGNYIELDSLSEAERATYYDMLVDRFIRMGTYGDPAAIPAWAWHNILPLASGHTGYTHQWKLEAFQWLKEYCMASVDSRYEQLDAFAKGWRTFRVALHPTEHDRTVELREVVCPASAEAGRKLTCVECKACDGNFSLRRGNIVIQAHGGNAVMSNVKRRHA